MRVLFTGLGSIGRRHLRLLKERGEEFDVHAYRSGATDRESPPDVTDHGTLQEALTADPKVAFITNPTTLHLETALPCAEAGCDLFIEKPISDSLAGLDDLEGIAEERGLITYVACNLRFNPVLQQVQEWLATEAIGEVHSFDANAGSYLPDWRPDQDYRDSYSASREMGGGVVLDLIHEFDYVYWLLGDAHDVVGRSAQVSHLDISSEDVAEAILTMKRDAIGSIHLDYVRRVPRRTFEIVGSEGVVHADLNEQIVNLETPDKEDVQRFDYERDDVYRAQLDYFLARVRERRPCHNDVAEAKRVLEIALEARAG